MKEHPILFSTPMVQAILENRKSQTRRKNGLDSVNVKPGDYEYKGTLSDNPVIHVFARMWKGTWVETIHINCPYGKTGDLLWVRESFIEFPAGTYNFKTEPDPVFEQAKTKWHPSIHMPKAAARIWLEIEEVKVERLQDISEEDAKAEGVEKIDDEKFKDYYHPNGIIGRLGLGSAAISFQSLWLKINGGESLRANPWVWVVKFKVLSTSGKPEL